MSDVPPRMGFSFHALSVFCDEHKHTILDGWTTSDVCDKTVKKVTADDQSSLVEYWETHKNGRAGKLVAPATHFVSHVWGYNFKKLVKVLRSYWEKQGKPDNMYIWYDCFVVNQHIKTTVPYQTLETLFGQNLKEIGRALVVLMDWEYPKYITRCWCLFELFTIMSPQYRP